MLVVVVVVMVVVLVVIVVAVVVMVVVVVMVGVEVQVVHQHSVTLIFILWSAPPLAGSVRKVVWPPSTKIIPLHLTRGLV